MINSRCCLGVCICVSGERESNVIELKNSYFESKLSIDTYHSNFTLYFVFDSRVMRFNLQFLVDYVHFIKIRSSSVQHMISQSRIHWQRQSLTYSQTNQSSLYICRWNRMDTLFHINMVRIGFASYLINAIVSITLSNIW